MCLFCKTWKQLRVGPVTKFCYPPPREDTDFLLDVTAGMHV
jgi:hypothetical protein